jgi:hypothetical protein
VVISGNRLLTDKAKMLVIAAMALNLGDFSVLGEIEKLGLLSEFGTCGISMDRIKVIEEALRVYAEYDLENVACHLVGNALIFNFILFTEQEKRTTAAS